MQKRMIEAMEGIPGVSAWDWWMFRHYIWVGTSRLSLPTNATDLRPWNAIAQAVTYKISPEYFQAAGTALLAGRTFSWHDDKDAPPVAVVNQEFARKIFGSVTSALGDYYKMQDGTRVQVVGIAEDGKYTANLAEDPQLAMFLPLLQSPASDTWLVLRSGRDPQQLAAAIRSKLRDLEPGLPAFIQTWNEEMDGALFAPRMATVALGVLGVMGAMLSITGIFGMAAYSVSKRLRELGIRIALGAQRKEVLQAALGRAFKLLAIGSAAGLLLGTSGDPGAGFHCVSGHSPRSAGIGWRCLAHVVAGATGYVDSSATRAVGRSCDTAARGVNRDSRFNFFWPSLDLLVDIAKAMVGLPPEYAEANVGHPSSS